MEIRFDIEGTHETQGDGHEKKGRPDATQSFHDPRLPHNALRLEQLRRLPGTYRPWPGLTIGVFPHISACARPAPPTSQAGRDEARGEHGKKVWEAGAARRRDLGRKSRGPGSPPSRGATPSGKTYFPRDRGYFVRDGCGLVKATTARPRRAGKKKPRAEAASASGLAWSVGREGRCGRRSGKRGA